MRVIFNLEKCGEKEKAPCVFACHDVCTHSSSTRMVWLPWEEWYAWRGVTMLGWLREFNTAASLSRSTLLSRFLLMTLAATDTGIPDPLPFSFLCSHLHTTENLPLNRTNLSVRPPARVFSGLGGLYDTI